MNKVAISTQVDITVNHDDGQRVELLIRGRWDQHEHIARYTITVMVPNNGMQTGWEILQRVDFTSETLAAEWLAPHLPIDTDGRTIDEVDDDVASRAHFALDVMTGITNTIRAGFPIYGRPVAS